MGYIMEKKLLLSLLCVLVLVSVISGCKKTTVSDSPADAINVDRIADISGCHVGNIVIFGSYEQDGDETNGKEPIEWEVLSVEENRALLVSKYVLDVQPYHNRDDEDVDWSTCTLRVWLNNDFLNTAFAENEQERIATVEISDHEGETNTLDKIFILKFEEYTKYYTVIYEGYGDKYCQKLVVDATPYAKKKGVFTQKMTKSNIKRLSEGGVKYSDDIIGKRGAAYWERFKGHGYWTGNISAYGHEDDCHYITATDIGVRPALYVEWK